MVANQKTLVASPTRPGRFDRRERGLLGIAVSCITGGNTGGCFGNPVGSEERFEIRELSRDVFYNRPVIRPSDAWT